MFISKLALDHFRSWQHIVIDLGPGVTIFQGMNGLGKTNIVEAVEVLSTGSSHRVTSAMPLVERGEHKATIRANVQSGSVSDMYGNNSVHDAETITTYEVTVACKGANRGRINGGPSVYMRDIVGRVPSVSFTPEDQRLVSGDPATRRGFLDQAGVLLVPGYASCLHDFGQIARQRVALLKQLGDEGGVDARKAALSGLEVWTGQFIEQGVRLTGFRRQIIDELSEKFTDIYSELSNQSHAADSADGQTNGQTAIRYVPSFEEVLEFDNPQTEISKHFQRLYSGEVARGRNLIGPHRDDMEFLLDGYPAREFASNGEMWTMALALKLALYQVIDRKQGEKPIMILDDVFAQLDETRRARILDFAASQEQVLITVAAASDIPGLARFKSSSAGCSVVDVAALKSAERQAADGDAMPDVDGALR